MPSRADVRMLQQGQQRVAQMARNELAGWWATIDKSDLTALRTEVERFFPLLVESYGEVAATAAADWYDVIYEERPRMAAGMRNEDIARARARWAIGEAWRGDAPQALSTLSLVADEMVRQFGRDTIVRSAGANKRMWARVPAGSETCAFCLTMASRGFAYHSKEDAGGIAPDKFHGGCDCEIVADDGEVPRGYDPDRMYEIYKDSHQSGDTLSQVVMKLREKHGVAIGIS